MLMAALPSERRFQVRKLTSKDEKEVLELVVHHYSRDLYLNKYGLHGEDIDEICRIRAKLKLKHNWSLGVFERSTKKLVAVSLNVVKTGSLETKSDALQQKKSVLPPQIEVIQRCLLKFEAGVFEELKADKIFYYGMGTVHKNYRRLGMQKLLRLKNEILAHEAGCQYMITSLSSNFLITSRSSNMGYFVLRELFYPDYVDPVTNLKPFTNMNPTYQRLQMVCKVINLKEECKAKL